MFGRKRQLAIAVQALRYYGDDTTWKRRGKNDDYQPAPFTTDHGKKARAALESIRDEETRSLLSRLFGRRQVALGHFRPPQVPAPLAKSKQRRRAEIAHIQAKREIAELEQRERTEAAA